MFYKASKVKKLINSKTKEFKEQLKYESKTRKIFTV